jgi:hypothetical protein
MQTQQHKRSSAGYTSLINTQGVNFNAELKARRCAAALTGTPATSVVDPLLMLPLPTHYNDLESPPPPNQLRFLQMRLTPANHTCCRCCGCCRAGLT